MRVLFENLLNTLFCKIVRCINESKNKIVEGKLRCRELLEYLNDRKAGTDVWLSEDASGIIGKIQYDSSSNQLIGMVLPFDNATGCPKVFESTARNIEEIEKFMQYNKSSLVYIVMATPGPPFLLQMYGTDNKFKAEKVVQRWDHTVEQLERYSIYLLCGKEKKLDTY